MIQEGDNHNIIVPSHNSIIQNNVTVIYRISEGIERTGRKRKECRARQGRRGWRKGQRGNEDQGGWKAMQNKTDELSLSNKKMFENNVQKIA